MIVPFAPLKAISSAIGWMLKYSIPICKKGAPGKLKMRSKGPHKILWLNQQCSCRSMIQDGYDSTLVVPLKATVLSAIGWMLKSQIPICKKGAPGKLKMRSKGPQKILWLNQQCSGRSMIQDGYDSVLVFLSTTVLLLLDGCSRVRYRSAKEVRPASPRAL